MTKETDLLFIVGGTDNKGARVLALDSGRNENWIYPGQDILEDESEAALLGLTEKHRQLIERFFKNHAIGVTD